MEFAEHGDIGRQVEKFKAANKYIKEDTVWSYAIQVTQVSGCGGECVDICVVWSCAIHDSWCDFSALPSKEEGGEASILSVATQATRDRAAISY